MLYSISLGEQLGQGAFGAVYKASILVNDAVLTVAVKRLKGTLFYTTIYDNCYRVTTVESRVTNAESWVESLVIDFSRSGVLIRVTSHQSRVRVIGTSVSRVTS